jgi:hypothetical protein
VLTHLGKVPGARRQWLANTVLYTVAGSATSMAVGYGLGLLGGWLLPPTATARVAGAAAVIAVAMLAAVKELGWVRVPMPEPRRQTNEVWVRRFGLRPAVILWGLDIGATVMTRFTFAGTWAIVLLPLLLADPVLGAMALLAVWLGRAAPVWVVPFLIPAQHSAVELLDTVADQRRLFRDSHVVGLVMVSAYVAWTAL